MRRTKEEAEKTRQEIIKAAIDVFSTKGFSSSTLVDIARQANVTRGAIYWHFKNKNDLFLALIEENKSKINKIIDDIRSKIDDPLLGLKTGIIHILKNLDSDPEYRAIESLIMTSKFAGEIDFVEERFNEEDHEGICTMRDICNEHITKNNCKNFDIETTIKVIGSFVYGAMILKLNARSSSPFSLDVDIEKFVEIFFAGIEKQ